MNGQLAIILLNFVSFLNCFKIPSDAVATGCQVDIKQLPLNTPLLLSLTTKDILYPDLGGSIINLKQKEEIEIDCPGTGHIEVGDITLNEVTTASCVSGWDFKIAGQVINISTVLCSSRITGVAQYTGDTCWVTGKEIEVGLQTKDGRFLRQYTSCFDDALRNVLYSHYHLTKQIGDQITGGTSPSWAEDNFYNLGEKVNNIYPKTADRSTINKEVGLSEDDEKYVKSTGNYYLAKGHLTARADFMYNAQQMSTFHYVNAAPQWQTFNGNNWFYLERSLRVYASNNFVDLEVYTGTYGISTLPYEGTGKEVEVYLFVDDNGNKALPIPELYWKVAYDPLNKAGVAVLGVNNPYETDIKKSIVCKDIADELTWLTFDRFKIEDGYIYACTIDDFRSVVPHFPKYDVQHILN